LKFEKIERDDFKALMGGTMDNEIISECLEVDTEFYKFPDSVEE
jgi:hypothetical protein